MFQQFIREVKINKLKYFFGEEFFLYTLFKAQKKFIGTGETLIEFIELVTFSLSCLRKSSSAVS